MLKPAFCQLSTISFYNRVFCIKSSLQKLLVVANSVLHHFGLKTAVCIKSWLRKTFFLLNWVLHYFSSKSAFCHKFHSVLWKTAFRIKSWLGMTFFCSELCVVQTVFCLKLRFTKISSFLVCYYVFHHV